ncbi:MAG: alpha/beta hydrolase [Burkholderiaceae bacterium]
MTRPADGGLRFARAADGPCSLLAIGGWIGPGEVWHDCFAHLPGWRCASYDHRGSGHSRHQRAPIGLAEQVDDLLFMADALLDGPCVLAAESAGAAVALMAALREPQRFTGLVLVAAAWRRADARALAAMSAMLEADPAAFIAGFVEQCLPETRDPDIRRWANRVLSQASPAHARELLLCRGEHDLDGRLGSLALPALILHGSQDRIVPASDSSALVGQLPNARLHVLEGFGHAPMITAPGRIAGLIDQAFPAEARRTDTHGQDTGTSPA